jgi:hypothetical protein
MHVISTWLSECAISGESGSVDGDSFTDWWSKLLQLLEGHHPRDIFNTDETGLNYRALPVKTLTVME